MRRPPCFHLFKINPFPIKSQPFYTCSGYLARFLQSTSLLSSVPSSTSHEHALTAPTEKPPSDPTALAHTVLLQSLPQNCFSKERPTFLPISTLELPFFPLTPSLKTKPPEAPVSKDRARTRFPREEYKMAMKYTK